MQSHHRGHLLPALYPALQCRAGTKQTQLRINVTCKAQVLVDVIENRTLTGVHPTSNNLTNSLRDPSQAAPFAQDSVSSAIKWGGVT